MAADRDYLSERQSTVANRTFLRPAHVTHHGIIQFPDEYRTDILTDDGKAGHPIAFELIPVTDAHELIGA